LSEIDERVVAAAEADLNRLLSIEPSPEFAAKVRARISEPQATRGWSAGWLGLALASVAALIIAVGDPLGWRVPETAPIPVHTAVSSVARDLKTALPPIAPSVEPPTHRLKTAPNPVARNRSVQPEVLIDPALGQAIRRLALSTTNLALDATTPDASAPPISGAPVPSVVVEPLRVPELVLRPADQTAVAKTGNEHKE
jgi:hypothetical protein